MEVLEVRSLPKRIEKVKKLILSAGNTIGSVHFKKRTDGKLRKMAFRCHVKNPTYAPKPMGEGFRKNQDDKNMLITIFDVNKVRRDKKGRICGRGDYRSISLEGVTRVRIKGKITKIKT